MKIIDLLNKIANGEINEDIEIEYQNGYNFEYCNIRNFFDEYIVDKENLNQEIKLVKSLEEEKKIPEKIKIEHDGLRSNCYIINENGTKCYLTRHSKMIAETLNQVIDYLKSKGE